MYTCNSLTSQFHKIRNTARLFHVSSKLGEKKKYGIHEGKTAVCVGCTEGLGYEAAKRLAEEGAHVVVGSRRQEKVDIAVDRLKADGLKASGVACHVGNAEQRTEILKRSAEIKGGIDILVNNAGVNAFHGPMLKTPPSAFEKIYDINVSSGFYLIQEAVPYMTNQNPGASIVVTSSASVHFPHFYPGAYATSKASILTLTRALMPELWKNNIRINCVVYGIFNTPFAEAITTDKERDELAKSVIAMDRYGEPEESAGIVSFLCSKDASYITGGSFSVNGGMTF